MKGEAYYSVRMRASENGPHEEGGKHISGGERLAPFIGVKDAVSDLLEKHCLIRVASQTLCKFASIL